MGKLYNEIWQVNTSGVGGIDAVTDIAFGSKEDGTPAIRIGENIFNGEAGKKRYEHWLDLQCNFSSKYYYAFRVVMDNNSSEKITPENIVDKIVERYNLDKVERGSVKIFPLNGYAGQFESEQDAESMTFRSTDILIPKTFVLMYGVDGNDIYGIGGVFYLPDGSPMTQGFMFDDIIQSGTLKIKDFVIEI